MSNERLIFYVDRKVVYVYIEYTQNKNTYLRIKDERIVVQVPRRTPLSLVKKFVESHINKFAKLLDETKQYKEYSLNDDNKYIYFFGKKYTIKILNGFDRSQTEIKGNNFYLKVSSDEKSELEKTIKKFLKNALLEHITNVQLKWEKKLNMPSYKIKVLHKTSSWGSNMQSTQTISYSSKLAHYSKDVIEYVVIHELIHHFEYNHSSNFWALIERHLPNFKDLKNQLRTMKSLSEE